MRKYYSWLVKIKVNILLTLILKFLFLLNSEHLLAQNPCECSNDRYSFSKLDSLADNLYYDELNSEINILFDDKNKSCHLTAIQFKVFLFLKNSNIDSARYYLDENYNLLKQLDCSKSSFYKYYFNTAEYYYVQNNYDSALAYSMKCLDISTLTNDKEQKAESNLRIANLFMRMKQPDKYKQYTIQAKINIEKMPEGNKKYYLLNTLCNRYINLYQDYNDELYIDTVFFFLGKINSYSENLGGINRLKQQYYRKMAMVFLAKKDLKTQLLYLDSAYKINQILKIKGENYSINGDKANVFRKLKRYKEAEIYADSCLYYAQADNTITSVINAYDIIYMVAKDAGNYSKALWAFENLAYLTDSLTSEKNTKAIVELEQQYNKDINERTIKELNQEKQIADQRQKLASLRIRILIVILILVGLIITVLIFIYRQRLLKQKQEVLEAEQRLNRSRMNPHFFFNALTSLQTLSMQPDKQRQVGIFLAKYSKIMRQTLESTYNETIPLEEEISFLTQYLDIQKLRFPEKFDYEIVTDDNVDVYDVLIPPMLLQPFIENSIEHGFRNISYTGVITIYFYQKDNQLIVSIKDNGNKSTEENNHKGYPSRATQIIKDRLYLINLKNKSNASFSIQTGDNGIGYHVLLYLPILKA